MVTKDLVETYKFDSLEDEDKRKAYDLAHGLAVTFERIIFTMNVLAKAYPHI